MPPRRAVELRVGGQTYRVVGSDNDQQVQRLAELVDRKFMEVVPHGRGVTGQQAMFLIAMALAEEAEEQRARAARLEAERDRSVRLAARAREVVTRLLSRVDSALSALPPDVRGAAPPPLAEPRVHPLPDPVTDPPDALHEPVLIELMPPSTRDAAWGSSPPSPLPPSSPAAHAGPGVPRAPRPGLRLVRHTTSSDDEPR